MANYTDVDKQFFAKLEKAISEQAKESDNIKNDVIYSDECFYIPAEYKKIVLRVNSATVNPMSKTAFKWPKSGSITSIGEKGFFAVLLEQEYTYIDDLTYFYPFQHI
jgi:hypothetical protein